MAHLKEQRHSLRGRIHKQTEAVRKHTEQFQLMLAKLDGSKREETEKDAQYRELCAKKLTPSSSPATSPLASTPRSRAVSVGDDDDLRSIDDNGGYESGMEIGQWTWKAASLRLRSQVLRHPPSLFSRHCLRHCLLRRRFLHCSTLMWDTHNVENGDDGSRQLRVDASIGQSVPDASTLSKALRRGQYTSDEARMLQKSLATFLEEHREELEDAAGCSVHFGEQEDRGRSVALASKMLGGPSS